MNSRKQYLMNKNPGEVGAISKLFKIPRTILYSKSTKEKRGREKRKRGPKPLLDDYFEKLLADFARSMDSLNIPLSADQIKDKVVEILKYVGKFDEKK